MTDLKGKRVAILMTNGFEDSEFNEPVAALHEHGAETFVVSTKTDALHGKHGTEVHVNHRTAEVQASDFNALLLPGGVVNGDTIRMDEHAVDFVRSFFEQHKPVAAICHGGWILTDADVLNGRTLTSFPSLKTDLRNAGATWVDEEVVVDEGLVTSRTPSDLPAFNAKMVEEIAEGKHQGQVA